MKTKLSLKITLLFMLSMTGGIARSQVGINTQAPKATLDVAANTTNSNKPEGFIAPRLTGDQVKDRDAQYGNDQTGAILYVTAAVTVSSTKTAGINAPGFYYFDGTVWKPLVCCTASQATITSLDCSGALHSGILTQGAAASGVSSVISYTGGNGVAYSGQTISSTGVTGLTATLSAGTLANGSGTLTYAITGTPSSSGTASFAISVGGQSCSFTRAVVATPTITALACSGATNNGTLTQGTAASGVSSVISYTGGNGVAYSGQTISSTGVTGLTAALSAGTLASGAGTLIYTITGTPTSSGTASFAISIGGQSCTLTRNVLALKQVTTFAGSTYGFDFGAGSNNGTGTEAGFFTPSGLAIDLSGNIYVADTGNQMIRKITPAAVVTTFAGKVGVFGNTNGTGTAATFFSPSGVTVDASGNLYVADSGNNKIRKITPAGVVTTFAGTGAVGSTDDIGTAATFFSPSGVTVDASGNLYVADSGNNKIRKITPAGAVTTFAGIGVGGSADGAGTVATFTLPTGVTVDASGNLYVADSGNNKIRKITPAGVVTTFAGTGVAGSIDGIGTVATFDNPMGIAVDASGNVYVADSGNDKIRKITSAGVVSTVTGGNGYNDGSISAARFWGPTDIVIDAFGNLYVADKGNHNIRKITFP